MQATLSKSQDLGVLFWRFVGGLLEISRSDHRIPRHRTLGTISVGHQLHKLHDLRLHQAREKSTKISFLGPETVGWSGGLPREGPGLVAEKFVPSVEGSSPWV